MLEHLGGAARGGASRHRAGVGRAAQPPTSTRSRSNAGRRPAPAPLPRLAGLPDDAFEHDGQLTKREVRAVTLAQLAPLPGERLWDIGAGCGSIAIEWLRAATAARADRGRARRGARRDDRAQRRRARRAGVADRRRRGARARSPACRRPMRSLSAAASASPALLPALWAALRPGGRLVANAVTLEGERALLAWQARHGGDLARIAVSRAEPLGGTHAWRPLLPVTQLRRDKARLRWRGPPSGSAAGGPMRCSSALCLLLYLPGIAAIPPLDRDEARFAQATRQMLETGDFLRIRFQDEARNKKPAGIYWLQAAAVGAVQQRRQRPRSGPTALPSLLGATRGGAADLRLRRALFGGGEARRRVRVAAVLLASALGVVAEAHIAKTDAALLAARIAGAGRARPRLCPGARRPRRCASGSPSCSGAPRCRGICSRGRSGPLLAIADGGALAIADRDMRWLRGLRPLVGAIAAGRSRSRRGWSRSSAPPAAAFSPIRSATICWQAGRRAGNAWRAAAVLSAAGARHVLAGLAVAGAAGDLRPGSGVRSRRERFLLAWLVPVWVVLELVPTKLPHYVLPLYPALALLAAAALVDGVATGRPQPGRAGSIVLVGALWVVVTPRACGAADRRCRCAFGDRIAHRAAIVAARSCSSCAVGCAAALPAWRRAAPTALIARLVAGLR